MSILSDVAVALRKDALEQLPKRFINWLESEAKHEEIADCESRAPEDRGRLFIIRDIRWDTVYGDVDRFYRALKELPPESYRVLEACHEHPETDAMDCGEWLDNPFKLRKYQTVELTWAEI